MKRLIFLVFFLAPKLWGSDDTLTITLQDCVKIYQQQLNFLENREIVHSQPFLILFSGIQGMGKSHLARKLESTLGAVRFSTNVTRALFYLAELTVNKANISFYQSYFLQRFLKEEKNKLLIIDASVDRSYDNFKNQIPDLQKKSFLIRIEIPYPEVFRRLHERNDFSLIYKQFPYYVDVHKKFGEHFKSDFDIVLNETVRLADKDIDDLAKMIQTKMKLQMF